MLIQCTWPHFGRGLDGQLSLVTNKNPPAVCLGRARVDDRWATVSPYSPCCFQELFKRLNPVSGKSCALLENFLAPPLSALWDETYSGIAGGLAAINSLNRGSFRSSVNSVSLYTLLMSL